MQSVKKNSNFPNIPSPVMLITCSTIPDIDTIFKLYALAIEYQKSKSMRHWFLFDKELLIQEIRETRHWKIMEQDEVACVFSIAFTYPLIWNGREKDPSIYLHRIVTNPEYMGNRYVPHIVQWAKTYGSSHGKKFIRLDTFSDNEKLNDYYKRCGFIFCGIKSFDKSEKVPRHYLEGDLSLFELKIE